jgi:phage protein D
MESEASVPNPVVYFGGQDSPLVRDCLLGLQLSEARGGLTSLELRLRNQRSLTQGRAGRAFDDGELVALGKVVSVGMGDQQGRGSMFYGVVTGLEETMSQDGPPEVVVLAGDALQQARLARKTQVYTSFMMSEFCAQLGQRLGLTPVVSGFDAGLGTQVQLNESDLGFLRRLLLEYDGEVQVIEAELHVRPIRSVTRGSIQVSGRQLERACFSAELAHQVTQVTVAGWDAQRGARISVTSEPTTLGTGTGLSGAQWLTRAIGARSEHVAHVPVRDASEGQVLANTVHTKRAREFVRVTATIQGNPGVRVGAEVQFSQVSSRFENTYVVTRTTHRYERHGDGASRGYRTDFDAECAFLKET